MPPSFPTTSSVAVATARILEAYLSNHKLSPAEAVSLSGRIADALVTLTESAGVNGQTAPGAEPVRKRRAKARVTVQAPPEPEPAAAAVALPESDPEVEPEREPESEPESEPDAQTIAEPAMMTADAEPQDPPVPAAEPIEVQQPEAEGLRKRKRPSRPRSRRGQGSGAAAASGATSDEEPEDAAPHDDEPRHEAAEDVAAEDVAIRSAGEAELVPEPVASEAAAEGPAVAAKPRRATSRARRVTAS